MERSGKRNPSEHAMAISVTDVRSSPADQIRHAAIVLGRSEHRHQIFSAIYRGKKKFKTVSELSKATGLSEIRVLQEGGRLASNKIVTQIRIRLERKLETAYQKDPFFAQHRRRILSLARDRQRLARLPTSVTPSVILGPNRVIFPENDVRTERITLDDVDSFCKVRKIRPLGESSSIYERQTKRGILRLLGEKGKFQDWGGETDDLFSTRIKIHGKRLSVAFALKGKGTKGTLTPNKMGKRGDQILRLFRSPADVYFVQYNGQIGESIIEQIVGLAVTKSYFERRKIYYGVIDGEDTRRLIAAYPDAFR